MKTAIGKFWARRVAKASGEDRIRFARLGELECLDLLDHAGPRADRNRVAHDVRRFRSISEGVLS